MIWEGVRDGASYGGCNERGVEREGVRRWVGSG